MNRRHLVQRLSMSMLSPKLLTKLYAHGQTAESSSDPKRPVSANDHVNVGVIGPGSRGLELTRQDHCCVRCLRAALHPGE